jgi:hypothetical protein
LTYGTFIRGINKISGMKSNLHWRDGLYPGSQPRTRYRKPVDSVRLLFQSMAWKSEQYMETTDHQRSEEDDEDLLDVLYMIMARITRKRNPKLRIRRSYVVEAAAELPSSCSRDLRGKVRLGDTRCVFELVTMLLKTRLLGTAMAFSSTAIDCMMSSFSSKSHQEEGIGWEDFRNVILGSFVSHKRTCDHFTDSE